MEKLNMLKNKKGLAIATGITAIFVILILVGISGGILTAIKLNKLVGSIPQAVWIGLIILIVVLMFPKKK